MSAPDLTDLNNLFTVAKNQYQQPIYNWLWRVNPFLSMVPRNEFQPTDGLVPEVITTTAELPTSYPDALSNLALSDGTGSSCDVDASLINPGYIKRTYQLEVDAWQSPVLCLTDLQFDWKAAQMIANMQALLGQYATVRISDWYRIKNLGMINTKVSTGSAGAYDVSEDANFDFTGVDAPTADLSWDHLNALYDRLIALGAGQSAPGMAAGQPVFALVCGPGIKRNLYQTDTKVRDTVNWIDAGNGTSENFTARGINTSINGFAPNVDDFRIRYAADGTTKIYPTTNTAATAGRKFIPNPNYKTVANGGLAVYEVVTVFMHDIWEMRPRPVGETQFDMAAFNPITYTGDIVWINNKDNDKNPRGNKGYYRVDFQAAAKPVRPEIGISILTLAKD